MSTPKPSTGNGRGEGEPVPKNAQTTAVLRHGVELPGNLFGLHELQKRGHQVTLVGREKVDGVNYYVLRITLVDGYETTLYVDPQSWLITRRRDVRPLHPDVDPRAITIETKTVDFRRVAGVHFGFSRIDTDLAAGKVLERTTITGITINPDVAPVIFEKL